jgi:hypothetical protein
MTEIVNGNQGMASVPDNDAHTEDFLLTSDEEDDGDSEILASKTESIPPPSVLLATAGYDHTIRFWDVVSGVCTNTLQYNISVHPIVISLMSQCD